MIIIKKITIGHMTSGSVLTRSPQENFSLFGPMEGFILHQPKITTAKKKAISSPGIMPAKNNFPIDCCVTIPKTINTTLSFVLVAFGLYLLFTSQRGSLEHGMGIVLCVYGVVRLFMYGVFSGKNK